MTQQDSCIPGTDLGARDRRAVAVLAETVCRFVDRGKAQVATHLVSRALEESRMRRALGPSSRPLLLNLRGAAYMEMGRRGEAMADFCAARALLPQLPEAAYNQGLCHKHEGRWAEMAACMQAVLDATPAGALRDQASWNLGLARAAQGQKAAHGTLPQPHMDIGLALMSMPANPPYAWERAWIQRLDQARARVLSVPRFSSSCKFGDVVLSDRVGMSRPAFGIPVPDPEEQDSQLTVLQFRAILEPSNYETHQVCSTSQVRHDQCVQLVDEVRKAGFHLEVWSLTMRMSREQAKEALAPAPVGAGLVVPSLGSPSRQELSEKALLALREAGNQVGVQLLAPTLMEAAGDELGARRHRGQIARGAAPGGKKG